MNFFRRLLTSYTRLQNKSFDTVDWTRTAAKCTEDGKARAMSAKAIVLILKYAMQIFDVLVSIVVVIA